MGIPNTDINANANVNANVNTNGQYGSNNDLLIEKFACIASTNKQTKNITRTLHEHCTSSHNPFLLNFIIERDKRSCQRRR